MKMDVQKTATNTQLGTTTVVTAATSTTTTTAAATTTTASKTSLLNNTIIRAWRERWSDPEWGIKIKTVLPRGVSGDVYNLAECLLQQALIGSNANPLVLNYLKHSLYSHLVSHAAVIRRIAKYEMYDRVFCITALLEFLESIVDGVTCRTKAEESLLPGALVSLVQWLLQIFALAIAHYELHGDLSAEKTFMLERTCLVVEKLVQNQFILAMLYVGRLEDPDKFLKIGDLHTRIKTSLTNSNYTLPNAGTEKQLHQLANIDVTHLQMPLLDGAGAMEPLTYCVQPLLAVEVLLNPCNETPYYVAALQMIQRLKHFTATRLIYEIIRAGFMSLSSVVETSHDTMWGAFTFFKVPQIIKHLNALKRVRCGREPLPTDYIPEVVEAIEMLLHDSMLLDSMDTKCNCNIIEYMLNDWTKQHLVNDVHVRLFSTQRETRSRRLQKREATNQAPSIINFIIRAEVPLAGILKTLSTDYNKVQESLLGVLCQVLVGNSFDLILSVATVEGRLKTFVARLIQCNENSKQVPGEVGKPQLVRSTLFDVSFLMLTFIVQVYGSEVVLPANGDSFFEKWVRDCMVERNRPKNPRNMVAACDENIVDELLLVLSKPEAQLKNSYLTWQDICINLPGVLQHVLTAWEKDAITSADVKSILDNIKRRHFSFSVCAASFLCGCMYSNEFLKPLNMVQQFLTPPAGEEVSTQDNVKERLGLSFQIIRKMQNDVHPSGNPKSRSLTLTQNLVSQSPLVVQFKEVWKMICRLGWMPVRDAQMLESLLQAGGPAWLARQLVEEIIGCKYTRDMHKTMDLAFAVLHLDIESTTQALLMQIVPSMVHNRQGEDINEPQLLVLARLCVYCVISSVETRQHSPAAIAHKKRARSNDGDEPDSSNQAKQRKLNPDGSVMMEVTIHDFITDSALLLKTSNTATGAVTPSAAAVAAAAASLAMSVNAAREPPTHMSDTLRTSLNYIFSVFQQFVATDELSPKIYFVYQFVSLLVECGCDRMGIVLKLLPPNLIQSLIKVMNTEDVSVGLISRLHDLRNSSDRQAAISDLCLWRNMQLKRQGIHF